MEGAVLQDMLWGVGACLTRAVWGVRQPQSVQVGAQTALWLGSGPETKQKFMKHFSKFMSKLLLINITFTKDSLKSEKNLGNVEIRKQARIPSRV